MRAAVLAVVLRGAIREVRAVRADAARPLNAQVRRIDVDVAVSGWLACVGT
jgi:hypothetical protein